MLLNAHVPSINKYRRRGGLSIKHLYLLSSWCIFILERENTALQYFYIGIPSSLHTQKNVATGIVLDRQRKWKGEMVHKSVRTHHFLIAAAIPLHVLLEMPRLQSNL